MDPWLHRIARSLTASHIASPVIDLECSPDDLAHVVIDRARTWLEDRRTSPEFLPGRRATVIVGNPDDSVDFVIVGGDKAHSDLWLEDAIVEQDTISAYTSHATPESTIDGATNFIIAIETYERLNRFNAEAEESEEPLLVLEDGRPAGALDRSSFFLVPVRMAVLSLLLELEESVVQHASDGWASLLPADRVVRAKGDFQRTTFPDKLTILRKQNLHLCLRSPSEFESLCHTLKEVRNWCAHTREEASAPQLVELLEAIHAAKELVLALEALSSKVRSGVADDVSSLNHHASRYCTTGQFAEAEQLYTWALAIGEKSLGPDHVDVALTLENFASLYRTMNRAIDAVTLEERAKRIRDKAP